MEIQDVRSGVYEQRAGFPREYGPNRRDVQPGIPFWPHEVYRDLVIVFLMCAIIMFLSAGYTPIVGPAANPGIQPFIVPDWYVLFSWGLVKIADLFPSIVFTDPLGNVINMDAAFWGNMLTFPLVLLPLFILPFVDRGRESRPAKAPIRSAFGVAFYLSFIFFASLYALNDRIIGTWSFFSDDALKWMILVPPVLTFFATYVGLRRLGFRDTYWTNVVLTGASFAVLLLMAVWAFVIGPWGDDGVDPIARYATSSANVLLITGVAITAVAYGAVALFAYLRMSRKGAARLVLGATISAFVALPTLLAVTGAAPILWFMLALVALSGTIFFAIALLTEAKAKQVVLVAALVLFFGAVILAKYFADTNFPAAYDALRTIALYASFFLGLPIFSFLTFYLGTREPYSTYEYLLNECYQCGKCHTVCPVTKVEDSALGGLNLVYNTFKKQHDGVPLWTCLACDACSAVCPLDIKYSDYILEERSKEMGRPVEADGGYPT